ncbi:hypothetical protein [Robertkochia aurantiaca]|uniref:hypothetical protein n=1 Tax=Robertkochia aurantiaca TaxID=2873700 RepID=UPI001CCF728E|nr:hypothetical protein [Robertkochia sp. 3YJGBD-33]
MNISTTFILLFLCLSFGIFQVEPEFKISTEKKKKSNLSLKEEYSKVKNAPFFEDENYTVKRTNSGEWGSSLWFKNKETGITYSCESQLYPREINKLNQNYYVTAVNWNLDWSSEIFEIKDPEDMEVFKKPSPRNPVYFIDEDLELDSIELDSNIPRYFPGDLESKSKKGTRRIIYASETRVITSFIYKNSLYHIILRNKKIQLAEIKNETFQSIHTLFDNKDFRYDVLESNNGEKYILFENQNREGHIQIKQNKIIIHT